MEATYQYGSAPTRNPFRWLLAAWRVSKDLSNTGEAAIVEIGFSRSWIGRKFAGWERTVELLSENESTLAALRTRRRLGPINIDMLANEPEKSLGRVFAGHCRQKGIDPNLVSISVENDNDFVMAHLFETHDIWHVVTGWGNDELGEVGLGGFLLAQLKLPLIGLMLALILLNTVFVKPSSMGDRMDALLAGYQMGKKAKPLFGVNWEANWGRSVDEIRLELGLLDNVVLGEGVVRPAS